MLTGCSRSQLLAYKMLILSKAVRIHATEVVTRLKLIFSHSHRSQGFSLHSALCFRYSQGVRSFVFADGLCTNLLSGTVPLPLQVVETGSQLDSARCLRRVQEKADGKVAHIPGLHLTLSVRML